MLAVQQEAQQDSVSNYLMFLLSTSVSENDINTETTSVPGRYLRAEGGQVERSTASMSPNRD